MLELSKESIDIVMPWVDGSDMEWQKEKKKYDETTSNGDNRIIRYRDWEMLPYWFRGIEKYAPWVRKIHFITWGHLPKWLNTENKKLNIVKHSEYIPSKYLPTFSSHPIELNIFRIKDLSEQFIYMNDDTYIVAPVSQKDFFEKGLPKDCALEAIHQFKRGGIDHIVANDLEALNANFSKQQVIRKNRKKWYSLQYKKHMLKNLYVAPYKNFVGFENPHIALPFLKSTFVEVWGREFDVLDKTCHNKFRSISDVNQWLMRYWQFASGKFIPGNVELGRFFAIGKDDNNIKNAILNQKYKIICLSDDDENLNFDLEKKKICSYFEEILPEKSTFEL